ACCGLRRSHPQGREACRPAGSSAKQVRAGYKSQNRQGTGLDHPAHAARPRRRGDRVMRRRKFMSVLGGAAAWPLLARAQQGERIRKIGVLMGAAETTDGQAGLAVFMQLLHQLGWTEDHNVQLEIRWGGGDPARVRRYAEELVALPAEVIMTNGALPLEALLRATRTVPIIFGSVT